uniref:Amino acid transporter n=1 Tax=Periophthalmus magnuspinnatus TaxID=409849 RepID=A0A3B4ALP3_9GOBI
MTAGYSKMAKQHGTLPGFNDMNNLHSKEDGNERKMNSFNFVSFLRRNAFVVLTLTAVIIGVSLGFWLKTFDMAAQEILYLSFPGELLMRVLQQMVLPLILSSLITGMSSLENKVYSKIGLRALVYYVVTTVTAAFTGIALASIIQPGKLSKISEMSSTENTDAQTVDSFLDLLRNMFPSNLVEACFKKSLFDISYCFYVILNCYCRNGWRTAIYCCCVLLCSIAETIPVPGSSDGLNILGLLVFCTAFGLALGSTGSKGQPLRDFFTCLNSAIMNLINIVICSATLPVTFYCMEENNKMDKQVTRFMLPIGATMNMDGAALYEAVAALFIAQVNNINFSIGQIIILSFIVTAASTGAAGIPQAGMVSMLIVLTSVGLPAEGISLLMLVDWLLDRLRTVTNVLGDCIGVGVVQHVSRHELQRQMCALWKAGEKIPKRARGRKMLLLPGNSIEGETTMLSNQRITTSYIQIK